MALGSTQLLTEMSTRNISKPVRRADMCLLSRNLGTSLSGHVQACNGTALPITHTVTDIHVTNVIQTLYSTDTTHISSAN
jgi:hypothetical protein